MLAHVRGRRGEIDVADPEHQARRLHASALVALLQFAAGGGSDERIGGGIDRDACPDLARPADGGEARAAHGAVRAGERVEEITVQQQIDAALPHQVEQQRFVHFRIEGRDARHVIRCIGDVPGRPAERDQPLDDLLRDATHDALRPRGARAVPRGRQRRSTTRVPTADHEDVKAIQSTTYLRREDASAPARIPCFTWRSSPSQPVSSTGCRAAPRGAGAMRSALSSCASQPRSSGSWRKRNACGPSWRARSASRNVRTRKPPPPAPRCSPRATRCTNRTRASSRAIRARPSSAATPASACSSRSRHCPPHSNTPTGPSSKRRATRSRTRLRTFRSASHCARTTRGRPPSVFRPTAASCSARRTKTCCCGMP